MAQTCLYDVRAHGRELDLEVSNVHTGQMQASTKNPSQVDETEDIFAIKTALNLRRRDKSFKIR